MELKDFISKTIINVVEGVNEAQNYICENEEKLKGTKINPGVRADSPELGKLGMTFNPNGLVQAMKFDVAITVTNEESAKGGIGVVIGNLSLGATSSDSTGDVSVSRIQFSVPVILPRK